MIDAPEKPADRMAKAREAKQRKREERDKQAAKEALFTLDGPSLQEILDQLEIVKLQVTNHLNEHYLKEEAIKPKPWIYRCSVRGCGQIFELPPPENRVGQPAPQCPTHGQVELYPISTPIAGYGSEG